MLKKSWEKLWGKISTGLTPGTTPIDKNFWKLIPKKSLILEVGCGWGRIVFECLKRGFNVVGIEINKKEVDDLNKKLSQLKLSTKVKIYNESIKSTPFKDETFSAVIMQGILSALPKESRVDGLHEIYRILKQNGYIHVAEFELITDNKKATERYENDKLITKEFGTLSVHDQYGEELYRTHNFTEKELTKLLESNNFNIISITKKTFLSYHDNKKPGLLIIAQKF